jgi:L-threonylcarbamoyladenylate synthase
VARDGVGHGATLCVCCIAGGAITLVSRLRPWDADRSLKTIPLTDALGRTAEIVEVLAAGNLACIPIRGAYRIIADARSDAALNRLAQSKRRAHNRPALILVSDLASACDIVDGTTWPLAKRITKSLWPGPLTLVLPGSERLPAKIKKVLTRSTGRIGIRVPDDALTKAIVREFKAPIVVSSANLENKPGSGSAATVRARFARAVDVWVDGGDMPAEPASTLVELTETEWNVTRPGAVSHDEILRALQ